MVIKNETNKKFTVGRYNGGNAVKFEKGIYLYVGSAMGIGATSLPNRLLRHAIKKNGEKHPVFEELVDFFRERGTPYRKPLRKTLRWHIDYILEHMLLEMIFFDLSSKPKEKNWARKLASSPQIRTAFAKIGSSDDGGFPHFFLLKKEKIFLDQIVEVLE